MKRKGGMFRGEARAGKIGSQPAFPEGEWVRVCGNTDERKNRREKQNVHEHHSISGQGSATGWERRRARRIDASFCLNYRRRSYDFLRPPPIPSSHFFSSFSTFRASSGHHSPIMSSVSSVYAHNFKDGGCWAILRNTLCKDMPWLRFKCRL